MASFVKYSGPWTKVQASHLIRRATFGLSNDKVRQAIGLGLDGCVSSLFLDIPLPSPPINVSKADDPDVQIGETWVDKPVTPATTFYRRTSLNNWMVERMMKNEMNIREKLTVFWHNHFVIADENDARLSYQYITLLRKNAWGNFKQLTQDITVDPAMLIYLNGRDNSRQAPNENYARELMELFTLGKGVIAGPGDYTTFTETDVKEIARTLTGWTTVLNQIPLTSAYRNNRHDLTPKQLSHRFNNVTITNEAENEYKTLINIIFQRQEVALFIARKLYRWFVNPIVTSEIENDIIVPMADQIRQDNYEMKTAIQRLLSCEHFYDECVFGTIIKNPIDFVANLTNQYGLKFSTNPVIEQNQYNYLYSRMNTLQMGLFQAPNVAGWAPFYQAPAYDGLWLNSTTLPARKLVTDALGSRNGINFTGESFKLDHIQYLDSLSKPDDANAVLDEILEYNLVKPVAANQRVVLKNTMMIGYTDAAWKTAYDAYKADPTSDTKRKPLIDRLTVLLIYMMRMPEYHLS